MSLDIDLEVEMKIAINRCYGGFGISNEAMKRLIQMGAACIESSRQRDWEKDDFYRFNVHIGDGFFIANGGFLSGVVAHKKKVYTLKSDYEIRTDLDLIKVINEMGAAANGRFAELAIVEIPDGIAWKIDDYDGIETVREQHRSWS